MKRKTVKAIWKVLVVCIAFSTVLFLFAPFAKYF